MFSCALFTSNLFDGLLCFQFNRVELPCYFITLYHKIKCMKVLPSNYILSSLLLTGELVDWYPWMFSPPPPTPYTYRFICILPPTTLSLDFSPSYGKKV